MIDPCDKPPTKPGKPVTIWYWIVFGILIAGLVAYGVAYEL